VKKWSIFLFSIFAVLTLGTVSAAEPAPLYKNPKAPIEKRVDDLLKRMTLEEKIGQMTQIDHTYLKKLDDITKYGLGSLLSGGNSNPGDLTTDAWAKYYDTVQGYALKSRLGIPLIYGVDAVHGHAKVQGATVFPHNIGLGATRNPKLVENIARITAIEMAATGIDWNFAPCITVPRDERWGRTYEGFSEDPKVVGELGAAATRGYQTSVLGGSPSSVLATAKHFVADGGTTRGKDQGDAEISEKDLREIHLAPYIDSIKAGAGSIMISFSSWNGEKLHGHKQLVDDVLRKELGFKGVIVSDWAAVKQLKGSASAQVERAINVGIDMVMVPDDYIGFIDTLTELVKKGKVKKETIDAAVRRILTAKFALGLFEHPYSHKEFVAKVGSPEHRAVARQAVRESIVLLKNDGDFLPLSKKLKRVHVVGFKADDVGVQSGGWTLDWQGRPGEGAGGTSILQAVRSAVAPGTEVTFSASGKKTAGADVAIVVIGEDPYAEFQGDRGSLNIAGEEQAILKNVQEAGVPYVIVLISGRPLIVTDEIQNSRAFVAAWLPGSEGQGVTDVLFGDYAPTGKLAYTWPREMAQIPINVGDGKADPLFPYGFGLTYKK
jgi:beta-glucosidase